MSGIADINDVTDARATRRTYPVGLGHRVVPMG